MQALVSRRRALKGAACTAALGAVPFSTLRTAVAKAMDDQETVTWSACTVNCGSRCPVRVVTQNKQIIRIETDNTGRPEACNFGNDQPQVRACLRGRSIKQRVYSKDRLLYPMKRVGERGEGKFERISWDQALDEIADKLKDVIKKYGNEAVFINHGSGNNGIAMNSRKCAQRFFNLIGGNLNFHSDYSAGQFQMAWPYLYGSFSATGYTSAALSQDTNVGSYMEQIANAKLYVAFGNNPAVTRASGGGQSYGLTCALGKGKPRVIMIDPIYTDSMLGNEDEWVPIRPGTDAALAAGMAYVMITENLVDQKFLDTYCIGYDEKTLPKSAPKGSDYKSYILGKGADKTPKTPLWASRITNVPVETIERLAKEIATTKPCFISQGWGPQRRMNGETQSTSIAMLALLTGQVGLPGTNTGAREGDSYGIDTGLPTGKNPVKVSFPIFLWPKAVIDAKSMTSKNAAVRGADHLSHNIKFIWNTQGNTLINQHGGINQLRKILEDDKLVETIVVVDNQMTPSAKFADYVLPDTMNQEIDELEGDAYAVGDYNYLIACPKAADILWDQRPNFEIMREMAKRFGVEDKYTEGRTYKEWLRWGYEQTLQKAKGLADADKFPSFDKFWAQGFIKYRMGNDDGIVLKAFREDPKKNPLPTPSGKIEIYSERLAEIAKNWELPKEKGQEIHPIPQFIATKEMLGQGDATEKKYPLELYGYHGAGRTHSTYHNVPWLRAAHPDQLMINPIDAKPRGIKSGDRVRVFNDRGVLEIEAFVTNRIIPHLVAMPQGAWYSPDKDGVDKGSCINTLTMLDATPLAKGNPSHTNLVEVKKI